MGILNLDESRFGLINKPATQRRFVGSDEFEHGPLLRLSVIRGRRYWLMQRGFGVIRPDPLPEHPVMGNTPSFQGSELNAHKGFDNWWMLEVGQFL